MLNLDSMKINEIIKRWLNSAFKQNDRNNRNKKPPKLRYIKALI